MMRLEAALKKTPLLKCLKLIGMQQLTSALPCMIIWAEAQSRGKMVSVCFYFQVHQPFRLRKYSVFEIGHHNTYFDNSKNEQILRKIISKCYLPANKILLDIIRKTHGKFKVSYSMTGAIIEQLEMYAPEVLDSFR